MKQAHEDEFREFVLARFNTLGRFAYLLCHDWHLAEDVVQKSLVKLYAKWPKAAIRSPDAYARKIIANTIKDEHRLGWFRKESPSETLPERHVDDSSEAQSNRHTVLSALAQLPKRQQLAVVLRFWEDMSVEQTAEIMGCSTGTVKSQTARGLKTLRGLLTEIPSQVSGAMQ
ncbi:MAG TPA: SigE family RNA polymerase sigma factor [Candidatus Stackebrandtia faecavium]|nr:SigE family RNA polymerase sigma factor [Candidatus Stackebrandtia faecavium]